MAKRPEEIQFNQLEGFVRQIMDGANICEVFIG
jgi:deoxyribodipyrimidine photolyase-like uncharacterized protein